MQSSRSVMTSCSHAVYGTATRKATDRQCAYLSLGGISGCSGGRGLIGSSCGTGGLGRVLPGGSNSGGGEPIPGTGSCRGKAGHTMQPWLSLATSIEQGPAAMLMLHTWGGLYSGGRLGWLGLPSSGRPHSGGVSMTPVVSGLPDAISSSSSWYSSISSSARNSSAAWCSFGYSLLGPGG